MQDVFVSYSHIDEEAWSDKGWIKKFGARLQELLKARGIPAAEVFVDKKLSPLAQWRRQIEKMAQEATVFVVMKSPSYFQSDWCRSELTWYFDKRKEVNGEADRSILVLKVLPDEEIDLDIADTQKDVTSVSIADVIEILKQFTPIEFYMLNTDGAPQPLFYLSGDLDANNNKWFSLYAEKLNTVSFFVAGAIRYALKNKAEARAKTAAAPSLMGGDGEEDAEI